MNSLPEDIQDTIYKYKHQMEFEKVMWELISEQCYCEWCGKNVRIGEECACVDVCVMCGTPVETNYPTKMCVCEVCVPDSDEDGYDPDWY